MGFSLQYTIHFGETPPKPESFHLVDLASVTVRPAVSAQISVGQSVNTEKTGDLMVNNGE